MIALKFRDRLPQWLVDEMDQLVAGIRRWGYTDHATTGIHNQVTFPDPAILSSESNVLDGYKEGKWVPRLLFGGAETVTYTNQVGSYTILGGMAFINFRISISAKGAGAGAATIVGLPPAILDKNPRDNGLIDVPVNTGPPVNFTGQPYVVISGGTLFLVQLGVGVRANITDVHLAANADIRGTMWIRLVGSVD